MEESEKRTMGAEEGISRRKFIKLGTIGAGALAAFGAFGCSTGSSSNASSAASASSSSSAGASSASSPASAAASSSASTSSSASGKEEISFKDQNDYDVTVAVPCERMVVLQHHSLDMLCQLGAQENIVGIVDSWKKNLGDYMLDVFPGIDQLPMPGGLDTWNVEQIAELNPDVVIAASQAPEDAMQQIRDLGIPVVVVSLRGEGKQAEAQNPRLADADAAYTEGCEWAVKTLGKLSGKENVAEEIWDFCLDSRSIVDAAVGDISDAERVKVTVLANGIAYGNDKYVGCQLLRSGAGNAAALAGVQGNTDYNAELVATWNPEVIITQDRYPDDYKTITTDPQYAELQAVKDGKVIEAPYWTKPWGNPDTDSIALGELWLAHTFYPEKVSAQQVEDKAKAFYDQFYGIDFKGTVK